MDDGQNKALAGTAETGREVEASGKGHRACVGLDRAIRRFAARLKRDFAAEIARDPASFKHRAVHRLKVYLPPGPGRPCLDSVTQAGELRTQGKPWKEIYPACIPTYLDLDAASRQVAQWHLRNAVRARRNTRRRRSKARAGSSAAAIPASDVSSSQRPQSTVV